MHTATFPITWSLDSLFNDTQKSFPNFLADIRKLLSDLSKDTSPTAKVLALAQQLSEHLAEASSFVHCRLAEDTSSSLAIKLHGDVLDLQTQLDLLFLSIDEKLSLLTDGAFDTLLQDPLCQKIAFPLRERREITKSKLPTSMEALITSLSTDGYHGHSQLFYLLHGSLKFPMPSEEGSLQLLSTGQIDNKLSSSCRPTREKAFGVYKKTFKEHEALFAQTLNHIAGFRLQVYAKRGWKNILHEPLQCNRMKPETLQAMWKAINTNLDPFILYIKHKAKLMGLKALSWHDIDIPLSDTASTLSYQQAAEFILEQFEKYSPHMAAFSKKALKEGWIEAEDRGNKAAGGFCVGMPLAKESRIFMTYSGSYNNLTTLAHELGHAYHNEIIFSHPYFAQNITMNVAETASTMAEMIVSDAALQAASSREEKLRLLDDKLSRSVVFFMNIQARFLFETAFYAEREQGYVLPERLSSLMEEAQKKAFHNTLSEWHPHFWASKMHFYCTEVPFYNFPYTFGYLFSLGIYALLKKNPASFEKKYIAFLADTPLMTSEELAKKHFAVDLSAEDFWREAMQEATKEVKLFLKFS